MIIACNHTHRFTKQFDDIAQEDIASCQTFNGISPDDFLDWTTAGAPDSIKRIIGALPYTLERRYTWLYIRPQKVVLGEPDTRSGSFFHIDVDAVGRCVAPDWDDFRAMSVSFGDVAETEFIADPFDLEVSGPPRSSDYVNFSHLVNNGQKWRTESPRPCQVAEYTIRDFHRAGPPRRSGWRLVILAFETNAPPVEKWVHQ